MPGSRSSDAPLVAGQNAVIEWLGFTGGSLKYPYITEGLPLELPGGTPTLEELWIDQQGEGQQQLRWEAFASCMSCKIPIQELQAIPPKQVSIVCILHYLLQQDMLHMLLENDIDVYLLTAVSSDLHDARKLSRLWVKHFFFLFLGNI